MAKPIRTGNVCPARVDWSYGLRGVHGPHEPIPDDQLPALLTVTDILADKSTRIVSSVKVCRHCGCLYMEDETT